MLIKNNEQIEKIKEGGKILANVLDTVVREVKPGISTGYLNKIAKELIIQNDGRPSFEGYTSGPERPYPSALCTSVNEQVVHAPAKFTTVLKSGDILSLDIGMEYKGCYTDMAVTVPVGKIDRKVKKLIKTTKICLDLAIKKIKPGNTLADVGKVIEDYAKKHGFDVVRDLVGHGVGNAVHEDPKIPNYYIAENEKFIFRPGMVLAIEPMLVAGGYRVVTEDDQWTISTRDRSLSAHFEHTVIVSEKGFEIATLK